MKCPPVQRPGVRRMSLTDKTRQQRVSAAYTFLPQPFPPCASVRLECGARNPGNYVQVNDGACER